MGGEMGDLIRPADGSLIVPAEGGVSRVLTREECTRLGRCKCDWCELDRAGYTYRKIADRWGKTLSEVANTLRKHRQLGQAEADRIYLESWRGNVLIK